MQSSRQRRVRLYVRSIAPELVAGASDNDPTNVGTAITVGAATAYRLAWVALLVAPLLGTVQTIAAQVGALAQSDVQTLARERYGRVVSAVLLISIIPVNIVTIAADMLAGAAGIGQLTGIQSRWLVVPLGIVLVVLLMVGRYEDLVRALRYLLLGFVAFGVTAILARPDWGMVVRASLVPDLPPHRDVIAGGLALLGTTLTSYVYVWETVGRGVEHDAIDAHLPSLSRVKTGAVLGAAFTAVVLWFILIASAATIGRRPQTSISIATAAKVLEPIAGGSAAYLFSIGLVISAFASLPVLLATTGYVVGAHFGWRRGLTGTVASSPGFYSVLIGSTALALLVTSAHVSVVSILIAASIIGGFGAPIGLGVLLLLARDPRVMRSRPISAPLAVAGWLVVAVVGGFGILYAL